MEGEQFEEVGTQRLRFEPALVDPARRLITGLRIEEKPPQKIFIERIEVEAFQSLESVVRDAVRPVVRLADRLVLGVAQLVEDVREEGSAELLVGMNLREQLLGELERLRPRREQAQLEPLRRQFAAAEVLAQHTGGEVVAVIGFEQLAPGIEADLLARIAREQQVAGQLPHRRMAIVRQPHQLRDG